jgi:hypothetical protein
VAVATVKELSGAADLLVTMANDRRRHGLLVATLGAVLLAVSVFLPWYGVSFTQYGANEVAHAGQEVIERFGNSSLSADAARLPAEAARLAGRQVGSVSAHDVLKNISVILLVLAGLALLDALIPLARGTRLPDGAGGALVLLGLLAAVLVAFRIAVPPGTEGNYLSLAPREGAWLSLLGAGAIIVGGLWPRSLRPARDEEQPPATADGIWSQLSGWTPPA